MVSDEFKPDSVVEAIVERFHNRAKFGKQKYGTDLDRTDLSTSDWINHMREELMDGILYLEKLSRDIEQSKLDRKIFG